jgi:hypothetical protein
MLAHLVLHYVGPSKYLEIELAPGLNLLTGDNGAGKTFLLDVAWWALTRTWVRAMARPWLIAKAKPRIDYKFESKVTAVDTSASFDRERWDWRIPKGRPGNPGLVLYARVDGGFAVWDPARNARRRRDGGGGAAARSGVHLLALAGLGWIAQAGDRARWYAVPAVPVQRADRRLGGVAA